MDVLLVHAKSQGRIAMKKAAAIIALITASLVTNSYAMNIKLKVAPEISNKISISYNIFDISSGYNNAKTFTFSDEFPIAKLSPMMANINAMLLTVVPIDNYNGARSVISFGYINQDGTALSPESCRNITAKQYMKIYMNADGCTSK